MSCHDAGFPAYSKRHLEVLSLLAAFHRMTVAEMERVIVSLELDVVGEQAAQLRRRQARARKKRNGRPGAKVVQFPGSRRG